MKRRFTHIALYILSITFLLSTVSFSVNAHYCGNILVDQSIVVPAKKCAMHSTDTDHKEVKDDCCNEKHHLVEGQDELQNTFSDDIQLSILALSLPADNFPFELQYDRLKTKIHFKDRAPPGKKYSLQILYQSFLI